MGLTQAERQGVRELRQQIAGALQAQVPDASVRCESTRALGYSLSFVFERETPGLPPERLFAKIRRAAKFGAYDAPDDGGRAARLGRQEYDTLRRTHAWFIRHPSGLGVVEPVLYLDAVNALVIRGAQGRALDELTAAGHPLALPAVARCGRWLRAFHQQVSQPAQAPWNATSFLRRFTRVADTLRASGVDGAVVARLRTRAGHEARRLDGAPHLQTTVHGDLKLRHVWAAPDRLDVIDFGNVHTAPNVEDLAAFVVELELLELGQRVRSGCIPSDMAAVFLDAYGHIETPALLGLELALVRVKKWARRRARFSTSPRGHRLQKLLRRSGMDGLAMRRYIDPWFLRRIDDELTWVARQPADTAAGPPFTAGYDLALREGFPSGTSGTGADR